MAGSINKVILVGNLGRDPEVRHTAAGAKIVHLSVATSDVWKDKMVSAKKKQNGIALLFLILIWPILRNVH